MADVKVSALSEATQSELTDSALALASVVDANSSTGFSSRKSTFAKLATYVLNTFTIALGGTVRTMKAAYDALYNVVSNHSSTLGSTSISGIGDGTVTGAISSLNSDLTKKQTLPYTIYGNRVTLSVAFAYQITDRFVFLYFKGTANQALNSNTIIQGLPVPQFAQGFMCNIGGAYAEIRANSADGVLLTGVPNGASFVFGGVYTLL